MATRAAPLSPTMMSRPVAIPHAWRDALAMLLIAFLLRCWLFGNPVIQVDEQFYLLVGDRLLHGAIPFVDIWDRKPVGLFLLYAAIRLLGGTGILQYQIVATVFAATTAFLVVQLARTIASPWAARMAGAASLVFGIVYDGAGGQAPVFYNPLVAGAALIVLRAVTRPEERDGRFVAHGAAAMALIGVAIQIKYTALFEGMTFGLVLLWAGWRQGMAARLAGAALLWIAIAVAPTVIAYASYVAMGHGDAFVYANFVSIGDRPASGALVLAKRLGAVVLLGLPLIVAAVAGLRVRQRDAEAKASRDFLLVWLIGATVGALALGTFYKHYFLPLTIPLAVFAAPAFDVGRRDRWRAVAVLALGVALAATQTMERGRSRGGARHIADVVALIRPHLKDRLFVFDGEPVLYLLTGAKLITPYAFPNHLNEAKEAAAIGVDPAAEVRRIMATRPSVVVSADRPAKNANLATWAIMRTALARDYAQVGAVRFGKKWRLVYALRA